MMKHAMLAMAASMPLLATDMPPAIPDGPIEYSEFSYDTDYPSYNTYPAETYQPAAPAPVAAASSSRRGYVNLNVFSSNYQVRGRGVCNDFSNYGTSSLSASCILPNRNIFGAGIYQRVSGKYGIIWDASSILGDIPTARVGYSIGKEIADFSCFTFS